MPTLEELNFLMELDEAGIARRTDAGGINERIREWLATPEGTVANLPGWGHQLTRLKFEPPGDDLEVAAEMLVSEKLPRDVKDVVVKGISVEFKEIDLMYLVVDYGIGVFEGDVRL